MKVLALIPAQKVMLVEAVQSLIALQADVYNRGDNINVCFTNGHNPVNARTCLANYAATVDDADYVLWMDSDHVYGAKKMYQLIDKLKENDLDMLSAAYFVRDASRKTAHGSFQEDGTFEQHKLDGRAGIQDCDVLGFGFLLMKSEFLRKMVEKYKDDLFHMDLTNNTTEDVYFCRQAKKENARVCYDADTIVGHLMVIVNK